MDQVKNRPRAPLRLRRAPALKSLQEVVRPVPTNLCGFNFTSRRNLRIPTVNVPHRSTNYFFHSFNSYQDNMITADQKLDCETKALVQFDTKNQI
ncbi:hypothetical protein MTP99_012003 [Tenebrio molitor]|nr:hypothetical protein MTP99_012003 [Tenebrio molitor]